jgi:hypothetical protein
MLVTVEIVKVLDTTGAAIAAVLLADPPAGLAPDVSDLPHLAPVAAPHVFRSHNVLYRGLSQSDGVVLIEDCSPLPALPIPSADASLTDALPAALLAPIAPPHVLIPLRALYRGLLQCGGGVLIEDNDS